MLNAPLSWMIAVLIVATVYSFFYLRRRRQYRRLFRPFLRRRRSRLPSTPFQFHLFDLQPMHLTGNGSGGGLDPSAIAALPIDHFAALKLLSGDRVPVDCAVCLSPFDDQELLRFIPKCQHAFHPNCLDPWLAAHTTCPSCRANLVPEAESTRSQPAPESPPDVVIAVEAAEGEEEPSSVSGGRCTLGVSPKVLWAHFWRQKAPLRLKILVCRVLSGAIPRVRRRRCALCGGVDETSEHLFFRCPVARALWYDFWGIRTDGPATGEWTAANWVEASLFPNRFLAFDFEDEGKVFLFLACLMDKIWTLRNRVAVGLEHEISLGRLKSAVEDSFWVLRSAFYVNSADHKL